MASQSTRAGAFEDAVVRSLDRKVCNTLNVCCIPVSRAHDLMPVFLRGLENAGQRLGQSAKLHVTRSARATVPAHWFEHDVTVRRAEGDQKEKQAVDLAEEELGREWEWEQTPEVSVVVVRDLWHAVELFNRLSPQFVACLVSDDGDEHDNFYERVNSPFVGDGFTRWVDGQYALNRPELGLSNWQWGRLFGRGGVLSGDTVYTVRTRVRGTAG
jgi:glutamate-5-semialdehyde dehydrogenase